VLGEIEDAIGLIEQEADDNADIIWGSVIKEDMGDEIRITVIATGFDTAAVAQAPKPKPAEAARAVAASPISFAPSADIVDEEDIDVPTFMRRQAD